MPLVVLTGQHAQLDRATFGLAAYPLLHLHCAAKGDPRLHAEAVAKRTGARTVWHRPAKSADSLGRNV
jgi:hypothetical protein